MIDPNIFSLRSQLISPSLEEQITTLLQKITCPVELTCILSSDSKCSEMAAFINHICSLSTCLSCKFFSPGENKALDTRLDSNLLPATGISSAGELPRMIFHGIPGGKEINAFMSALLVAGNGAKPLDRSTLKDISKIKQPTHVQICVSLGCQHCSQLVAHAHRIAWENKNVTAHMIDAGLYPDLVKEYALERVPLTVINSKNKFLGGKTMDELISLLLIK